MKFQSAITPTHQTNDSVYKIIFNELTIAVEKENQLPLSPLDVLSNENGIYVGTFEKTPCYVLAVSEVDLPQDYQWVEYRSLYGVISDEWYATIGYAKQILTWRTNHQYCSKCGSKAEPSEQERAMVCPDCGFRNYPRISPSIIVAITKDRELLMARSPHFRPGLYSLIAGFLEPGETLEQCVEREVFEETGLKVKNIRYFKNQPWAFPHSLMVGFEAEYASGELKIDPNEIEDAGWYTADKMPAEIPTQSTIARWLIDSYLERSSRASEISSIA